MRNSHNSLLSVAITKCFFCQEDSDIVLNSRLTPVAANAVDQMHGKTIDMSPCSKCEGYMKRGVILITIDDKKSGEKWWSVPPPDSRNFIPNPYRTGGWFVITDDAVSRIIRDKPMADWALKHRWIFIEHEAAKKIGLFAATPTHQS